MVRQVPFLLLSASIFLIMIYQFSVCRKMLRNFPCLFVGHLAPEGVLALQTNFYINQMRDLVSDSSKAKNKGCKKHNKPFSHFCRSCELQICVECCTTDHRESAGHSTQDINRYVVIQ